MYIYIYIYKIHIGNFLVVRYLKFQKVTSPRCVYYPTNTTKGSMNKSYISLFLFIRVQYFSSNKHMEEHFIPSTDGIYRFHIPYLQSC